MPLLLPPPSPFLFSLHVLTLKRHLMTLCVQVLWRFVMNKMGYWIKLQHRSFVCQQIYFNRIHVPKYQIKLLQNQKWNERRSDGGAATQNGGFSCVAIRLILAYIEMPRILVLFLLTYWLIHIWYLYCINCFFIKRINNDIFFYLLYIDDWW